MNKKSENMRLQDLLKLIYFNDISELKKHRSNGVDFTICDPQNQNNLLIAYSGYGYDEKYSQKEMVQFLLECGIDINHQRNGRGANISALHMAVSNGLLEIIKTLLEHGADIEIKDKNGNTPLWNAIMNFKGNGDELAIINYLISKGGSIDTKNAKNISPRDIIIERGQGIGGDLSKKEWDLRSLLNEN